MDMICAFSLQKSKVWIIKNRAISEPALEDPGTG
jgi:hypothetical protein